VPAKALIPVLIGLLAAGVFLIVEPLRSPDPSPPEPIDLGDRVPPERKKVRRGRGSGERRAAPPEPAPPAPTPAPPAQPTEPPPPAPPPSPPPSGDDFDDDDDDDGEGTDD